MSRIHIHVGVEDLDRSIGFYSTLFGAQPTRREPGYAKWQLDDPRVNFAISTRGAAGLSHLGIEADTRPELDTVAARAKAAAGDAFEETDVACCYAKSDKAWVTDPAGLRWETFHTHGTITTFGEESQGVAPAAAMPAVAPAPRVAACCG